MKLFRTASTESHNEIASRVIARREALTPVDVTVNEGVTMDVSLSDHSSWPAWHRRGTRAA